MLWLLCQDLCFMDSCFFSRFWWFPTLLLTSGSYKSCQKRGLNWAKWWWQSVDKCWPWAQWNVEVRQPCREIRQQIVTPLENISSIIYMQKTFQNKSIFLIFCINTCIYTYTFTRQKFVLKWGVREKTYQHFRDQHECSKKKFGEAN